MSLEKLYDLLDFDPGANLATIENPPKSIYEKRVFETAREKLGVESVFFYQPPNGQVAIPYIYFCRLSGQANAEVSTRIADLHRLAWNKVDPKVKTRNTLNFR